MDIEDTNSECERPDLKRRAVVAALAAAMPAAAASGTVASFLMGSTARAADDASALTATQVVSHIKAGNLSAENFCKQALKTYHDKIGLNTVTWIDEDRLLASAREVDLARSRGTKLAPLAGLPIIIKDNIDTVGFPTSAGTRFLQENHPKQNAPVVDALYKNGALLFAKSNMHELALGGTSNNPVYGAVGNPYAPTRVPGGSSGGTAAAIAARIVPAGLGTDTSGSVRMPSFLCGIAGLRPSIGGPRRAYSVEGVVPLRLAMDTIGPMARTVEDVALLHAAIMGQSVARRKSLRGVRLGVPGFHWDSLEPEVARVAREGLKQLQDEGVVLVDVEADYMPDALRIVGLLSDPADFDRFLARNVPHLTRQDVIDGIASADVKFLWQRPFPSAEDHRRGVAERKQLQAKYAELLRSRDIAALIFPTMPITATPIHEGGDSPKDMFTLDGETMPEGKVMLRNTQPTGVIGAPGLSLPIGLSRRGLPVGFELDGAIDDDDALLSLGMGIEAVLGSLPAPV